MEGRQYFVGGLSPETTDDDLRFHFEDYGEVLEAKVMRLKGTSQSRGFGFVTLQEPDGVPLPLEGHHINGKNVDVKPAVPANEMHTLMKTRRCFVGGLPHNITVEELAIHFKQFGRVVAVELPHERSTGKFLNCAFVTFEKDEASDAAVHCLLHEFGGKPADVKKADPRPLKEGSSAADIPTAEWSSAYPQAVPPFPHLRANPAMQFIQPPPPLLSHRSSAPPTFRSRRAQDVTGMYFIGGLNRNTTSEDLKGYFSEFGEVKHARIVTHEGKSRGFGFITFYNPEQAVAAGLMTHAHTLQGNTLDVKSAVPEEELGTVLRTKRIFVGALPPTATQEIMWEHFQQFGRIIDCEVIYDKITCRPKGCGFVIFESEDHAENAVRFPLHMILGQRVDVKKAEPRSRQPNNPQYQVSHGIIPQSAQPKKPKRPELPDEPTADLGFSYQQDPANYADVPYTPYL